MIPTRGPEGAAALADYEDSVLRDLRERLEVRVAEYVGAGVPLPDPQSLAAAMIAGIPDVPGRHPYASLLGPFYSSASVMQLLGIPTKQALDDRRRRWSLLAAQTQEGAWVYPSLQFDTVSRRVRPELAPVLHALRGAPRWGAGLWLVTQHPELGGRSPLEAAKGPDGSGRVAELARQYVAAVTSQ